MKENRVKTIANFGKNMINKVAHDWCSSQSSNHKFPADPSWGLALTIQRIKSRHTQIVYKETFSILRKKYKTDNKTRNIR